MTLVIKLRHAKTTKTNQRIRSNQIVFKSNSMSQILKILPPDQDSASLVQHQLQGSRTRSSLGLWTRKRPQQNLQPRRLEGQAPCRNTASTSLVSPRWFSFPSQLAFLQVRKGLEQNLPNLANTTPILSNFLSQSKR